MDLENGNLPKNHIREFDLLEDIISSRNLIEEDFGEYLTSKNFNIMKDYIISAFINKEVSKINTKTVDLLQGKHKSYESYDSVKDKAKGGIKLTPGFFNSIDTANLPHHALKIRKSTKVILLRRCAMEPALL